MSSLDNFPSHNGAHQQYPTLRQRHQQIQYGLHSSKADAWDLPNALPMAPSQPADAGLRQLGSSRPDPQITERLSHRSMKSYLVPTQPRVYARRGDTVDGIQLMDTGNQSMGFLSHWFGGGSNRARINTFSRFHPYLK